MVGLKLGDVIDSMGQRCIVEMVNDCRARVVPLDKVHVVNETRFGKAFEFDAPGKPGNVCVHVEPGMILERRGKVGLDEFLATRKARRREGSNDLAQQNIEGKETDDTSSKKKGGSKNNGTPRD